MLLVLVHTAIVPQRPAHRGLLACLKRCCRCKAEKPQADFGKNRARADGLTDYCKDCHRATNTAWREAHPGAARESKAEWKRVHADLNRVSSSTYRQTHRAKVRAYKAAWYLANVEKVAAYDAARQKAHPEKGREQKLRRKVRLRGGFIEKIYMAVLVARDKGLCGICGQGVPVEQQSIDHILPISYGGSHSYANVRLTHRRCNVARGNRLPAQLRMLG